MYEALELVLWCWQPAGWVPLGEMEPSHHLHHWLQPAGNVWHSGIEMRALEVTYDRVRSKGVQGL